VAGHVIVCGMGQVGYRVVILLGRLGQHVTVITLPTRDEWVREAKELGANVIVADARDPDVLAAAGLADAEAVIAVTDQDAVNIGIALDAKRICPGTPVVVRLFDQGLARLLENTFDIRKALGMSTVAAPAFAAAALANRVVASFSLEGAPYVIGRITVEPGGALDRVEVGALADRSLAAVALERTGGQRELTPDASADLRVGDVATVVAPEPVWKALTDDPSQRAKDPPKMGWLREMNPRNGLRLWRATPMTLRVVMTALAFFFVLSIVVFDIGMGLTRVDAVYFITATITTTGYGDISAKDSPDHMKLYAVALMLLGSVLFATLYSTITDMLISTRFAQLLGGNDVPDEGGHIVVAGLGNLGYRLVEELRRSGVRVVPVEHNPNAEFVPALLRAGPAIIGDARLADTLVRAGVPKARCVVAATGDDAANLAIALTTEELNPGVRSVMRLFDADFAGKVQGALNVDAVMSAPVIAAPAFVASALHDGVLHAFEVGDRLVVLVRERVGLELAGRTPRSFQAEGGRAVLLRRPDASAAFTVARGDAPLALDEDIVAVASYPLRA
jgi:Trk K+ transport system NAD-binding subunit